MKTQKQHYLPAVYISQFSPDGPPFRRASHTWRSDKEQSRLVPAESQCFKKNFYDEPGTPWEGIFGTGEHLYAGCVKKIRQHQNPTRKEYFGLILFMMDLHIRNISYENLTNDLEIRAYLGRVSSFEQQLLKSEKSPAPRAVLDHLREKWRVQILTTASGVSLYASDNPSVWLTHPDRREFLDLVILPLTPHHCAVAFDSRRTDVVGHHINSSDATYLNSYQLRQCRSCLYTLEEISPEDHRVLKKELTERRSPFGFTDLTSWEPHSFDFQQPLSFLRMLSE